MKLYYAPGACSLSPHIALSESGLPYELVKVDLKVHKTESGEDFKTINPKGQVPTLQLDGGEVLTEGPVILQMIADKASGKNLAPASGTKERYRLQEWLNYIGTELHKTFSPMFNPALPSEVKDVFKSRVTGKFKYVDEKLAGQDFLMGQFSVADGYLYVMLRWADMLGVDLSAMKNLMAFKERMAGRPNVQAALKKEGLLKAA